MTVDELDKRVAYLERFTMYLESSLKEMWKQERSQFENEIAKLKQKVEFLSYLYTPFDTVRGEVQQNMEIKEDK